MIKRVLSILFAVLFVFSAFKTISISATENVQSQECSLTINYLNKSKGIENLEIKIYRVAKPCNDGSFEKIEPFSSYPVSVYDGTSKEEWKQTALTLESYIKADKIKPYQTDFTSKSGEVVFSELESGLYLVSSVVAKQKNKKYYFDAFMISLPTYQNGEYDYDVKAQPKADKVVQKDEFVKYKILKLWKDIGNKNSRPNSVKVDILKDGVFEKTVILSAKNNWFYSFKALDDGSVWSVVERNVAKNYRVKISKNKTTFTLTNTHENNEDPNKKPPYKDAPGTGDTFNNTLYVMLMCFSGLVLVISGVGSMRGRKNEQKK